MIHSPFVTSLFIWVGIAFCIIQSAMFSGLNLAIFSVSKLRLEVEAAGGNRDAISLLGLRKDSNLTLSAVLWGNVTINLLLPEKFDVQVRALREQPDCGVAYARTRYRGVEGNEIACTWKPLLAGETAILPHFLRARMWENWRLSAR